MNSSEAGKGSNRSEPEVPELDASRFEMLEAVGSGGMGTVYRAVQRSVGRHVAVKVLAPEHAANATGLSRFVREANIIARLTHPNIVQLIDFGRDRDGKLLLVMELLEGESLRALLRREGKLSPERAIYVAVQTLNALRVAHAAGVVHRDLKPENIFIHRSGDDDHVKVLDFGVAKLTASESNDNTTQGSLVGTLRYMAPEQIAGETPDHRIDIYAVGMVLYEMLAAALPYETRDRFVLLRQIIAEEPMHLLLRAPEVSPELAALVMRAIEKTPHTRFQSADEFRKALTPFLAADHARLQALADASTRGSNPGASGAGGEIRSGIVRSGHVQLSSSALHSGASNIAPTTSGSEQIAYMHGAPAVMNPSAPGYASAPGYGVQGAPQMIAPAPQKRSLAWVWVLVAIAAAGVIGGVIVVLQRPEPRREAPIVEVPRASAQPVLPPPPQTAAATRMVTLTTTPMGAQVLDANGATLCVATPCAIPVPVGGMLAVRIVREGVALSASLDASNPSAHIDLSGLIAPTVAAPVVDAGSVHHGGEHRRQGGGPRNGQGGGDLPMFLPHGG